MTIESQQILDRVVAHMMEQNKDEIGKAWGHFYDFGTFCLRHKEDGTVEAVHPLDMIAEQEPEPLPSKAD